MIDLAWMALLGLGGLGGLWLLVERMVGSTFFAAFAFVIVVLLQWEFASPITLANVGGVSIQLFDLLAIALILTACWNAGSRNTSGTGTLRAAAFLAVGLVAVAVARGISTNGIGSAVNESREAVLWIATCLWALSLDYSRAITVKAIERAVYAGGWFLCALGTYHIARYGLGQADTFVDAATGLDQTSRPLVAGQALFLLIALIFSMTGAAQRPLSLHRRWAPLVFVAIILASQQRTVWAAAAVAILAYLMAARRTGGFNMPPRAVALGVIAISLAFSLGPGVSLVQTLRESAENLGTFEGRLDSQAALWSIWINSDLTNQIFGTPFGSGYTRIEVRTGRLVEYSPHSMYLLLLLRAGALGLLVYVSVLSWALVSAWRGRSRRGLVILIVLIVFGWAYTLPWYCLMALAGLPIAADRQQSSAEEELGEVQANAKLAP